MLERLRKSVAGTLAKILIGLLVVSFSLWGIGDVFGSSPNPIVAQVGSDDIKASKFIRFFGQNYSALRLRAREQQQDITVEQARQAGLDRRVLASLVSQSVLEQSADDIGLSVSNDELLEKIQEDESFKGPFGRFDATNFKNVLQGAQMTEDEYFDELAFNLTREQFLTIFRRRPPTPKRIVRDIYQAQNERRIAEYVILKPNTRQKVARPSNDDLEAFIDNNSSDFTLVEKRKFELLLLDPKKFTAGIRISNKALRAEYQARLLDFQIKEQRLIQQIVFPSKGSAQRAYKATKAGTSLTKLAKRRGLSKEDISLGWLEKGQYVSITIEKTALKLRAGATSKPIETALGWVLLRVAKIKSKKQKSFTQARKQLQQELVYNQAQEEIDDLHDIIEDEIAGGEPFSNVAKKYKLKLVKSKLLKREDKMPRAVAKIKTIEERVWSTTQEEPLQALPTEAGGYFWLALTDIQPSRVQNLTEAKSKARKLWQRQKRLVLLKIKADEISKKVAAGASLKSASKLSTRRTPPLARFAESEALSTDLIEALFRTPRGGSFQGVSKKNEIIIAKVAGITQLRDDPKNRKELGERILKEMVELGASELLQQFLTNRQKQLGVNVFADNIDLAFEQAPQNNQLR